MPTVHSTEQGAGPFSSRARGTRQADETQVKTQVKTGEQEEKRRGGVEETKKTALEEDEEEQKEEKERERKKNGEITDSSFSTGRGKGIKFQFHKSQNVPIIYVVTPTYARPTQIPDLTRVAYSLILAGPNIHWVIVEDSSTGKTSQVTQFISYIRSLVSQFSSCKQQSSEISTPHSRTNSTLPSQAAISNSCSCPECTCSNLAITHLTASTPVEYKIKSSKPNWLKPRGVAQRNRAILWLKDHTMHLPPSSSSFSSPSSISFSSSSFSTASPSSSQFSFSQKQLEEGEKKKKQVQQLDQQMLHHLHSPSVKANAEEQINGELSKHNLAVVYFADDDNTYDERLFREMRYTETVSVWPVGIVGGVKVERPILDNLTGKVIGFTSAWKPKRPFPIDMAGFAINLSLLLSVDPLPLFTYDIERGYQESHILSQVISSWSQLQPKAANCTKIYVWHTRSEKPNLNGEAKLPVASDSGIVYPVNNDHT